LLAARTPNLSKRCQKLATLRKEICPNGTEVQEQLFGNLEQLHQTTMYITEAGLRMLQKKKKFFHNRTILFFFSPGIWYSP
jgi:hypothetical protein